MSTPIRTKSISSIPQLKSNKPKTNEITLYFYKLAKDVNNDGNEFITAFWTHYSNDNRYFRCKRHWINPDHISQTKNETGLNPFFNLCRYALVEQKAGHNTRTLEVLNEMGIDLNYVIDKLSKVKEIKETISEEIDKFPLVGAPSDTASNLFNAPHHHLVQNSSKKNTSEKEIGRDDIAIEVYSKKEFNNYNSPAISNSTNTREFVNHPIGTHSFSPAIRIKKEGKEERKVDYETEYLESQSIAIPIETTETIDSLKTPLLPRSTQQLNPLLHPATYSSSHSTSQTTSWWSGTKSWFTQTFSFKFKPLRFPHIRWPSFLSRTNNSQSNVVTEGMVNESNKTHLVAYKPIKEIVDKVVTKYIYEDSDDEDELDFENNKNPPNIPIPPQISLWNKFTGFFKRREPIQTTTNLSNIDLKDIFSANKINAIVKKETEKVQIIKEKIEEKKRVEYLKRVEKERVEKLERTEKQRISDEKWALIERENKVKEEKRLSILKICEKSSKLLDNTFKFTSNIDKINEFSTKLYDIKSQIKYTNTNLSIEGYNSLNDQASNLHLEVEQLNRAATIMFEESEKKRSINEELKKQEDLKQISNNQNEIFGIYNYIQTLFNSIPNSEMTSEESLQIKTLFGEIAKLKDVDTKLNMTVSKSQSLIEQAKSIKTKAIKLLETVNKNITQRKEVVRRAEELRRAEDLRRAEETRKLEEIEKNRRAEELRIAEEKNRIENERRAYEAMFDELKTSSNISKTLDKILNGKDLKIIGQILNRAIYENNGEVKRQVIQKYIDAHNSGHKFDGSPLPEPKK